MMMTNLSLALIRVYMYFLTIYRTARGDNQGTALSFVSVQEMKLLKAVEEALSCTQRESILLVSSDLLFHTSCLKLKNKYL